MRTLNPDKLTAELAAARAHRVAKLQTGIDGVDARILPQRDSTPVGDRDGCYARDGRAGDAVSLRTRVLGAISGLLMDREYPPKTYVIQGGDGSPYLTRTLFPRVLGHRVLLHRIHRADEDDHPHSHPWESASFRILSGGYVEERVAPDGCGHYATFYRTGDVNRLTASTFHRITEVLPNTWTLGLIGARVQSWGLLVDGTVIPWREYLAARHG